VLRDGTRSSYVLVTNYKLYLIKLFLSISLYLKIFLKIKFNKTVTIVGSY